MSWDFATDPEWAEQLAWVEDFVRTECEPIDYVVKESHDLNDPVRQALIPPLQQIVKDRGLWATPPGSAPRRPGLRPGQARPAQRDPRPLRVRADRLRFAGTGFRQQRDPRPLRHARAQERYLEPLLDNRIISCFSMTEPQGGADPKVFTTSAVQDGDHWVINGEKWYLVVRLVRPRSSS